MDEAQHAAELRIGPDRLAKWISEISETLSTGKLSPAKARKLAGKLGWGACAVFGRGARVYLAPLFYHASRRTHHVHRRLRMALLW